MVDPNTRFRRDFIKPLARELGIETYLFGYPLVLLDVTRAIFTSAAFPNESAAPVNLLSHTRSLPYKTVIEDLTPNVDTLRSSGFLDLSAGPIALELPDFGDRYFSIQVMDAWSNVFASLGTRTYGNQKRRFVIAGPDWNGKLTQELQWIQSPTNSALLIGRVETCGNGDAAAHALQDRCKLVPIGPAVPSQAASRILMNIDMTTPPTEQVAQMDVVTFLNRMSVLMRKNPPLNADAQISSALITIGLLHRQKVFRFTDLDPLIGSGLESGCRFGHDTIVNEVRKSSGQTTNGWEFSGTLGTYGNDYLRRAVVAMTNLGASLQKDADYASIGHDENGEPLDGTNRYIMHFPSGQLPPVNAFWSVTLYDRRGLVVQNPMNRFAIGSRDPLEFNPDGSLTLLVQHEPPAASKVPNWLPAPAEEFTLTMRLYWPKTEILCRTWRPPRIYGLAAAAQMAA